MSEALLKTMPQTSHVYLGWLLRCAEKGSTKGDLNWLREGALRRRGGIRH